MAKTVLDIISNNQILLRNVFLTLILQVVITFCVLYISIPKEFYGSVFLIVNIILSILIVIVISASNLSIGYKFALFVLFSVLNGMFLSPLKEINNEALQSAVIGAISVFVLFLLFGLFIVSTGYDMSWMGMGLLIALLLLIITGIITLFTGMSSTAHKVYLYLGLVLFSIFIMYDTDYMLRHRQDFVSSALAYYLDFFNIFIRMFSLFNGNKY